MKKQKWVSWMPIIVWVVCLTYTGVKMFRSPAFYTSENCWISIFDWFSSNTLSAFISIVLVMIVQFYSSANDSNRIKGEKSSGLSKKYISVTIIATLLYYTVVIIDACLIAGWTSILMFIYSILYIILYFTVMRVS